MTSTETPVRLCRDCKWCKLRGENSRCLAPSAPKNKQSEKEAAALALVDPSLTLKPDLPFCTLEREWTGSEYCGPEGRRWEPAEQIEPAKAPTLTLVES